MASTSGVAEAATRSLLMSIRRSGIHCCAMYVNGPRSATISAVTATMPDLAYPLDGDEVMPVCKGTRPRYSRALFWRTQERAAARVGNWKDLDESGNERL